jgi:hypothetical protein
MKETVARVPLSDFFRAFAPTHVLGTTYTLSLAFFESQVFSRIPKKDLKRCLVLCDQKGLRSAAPEVLALRNATSSYSVVTAPTPGSFHAKVWLMLRPESAALLVGSGNLTQSGFIDNAELFDVITFRPEPGDPTLTNDVRAFLDGLYGLWTEETRPRVVEDCLAEARTLLMQLTAVLPPARSAPRFLSNFGRGIAVQLADFGRGGRLYVAAPYFGKTIDGLKLLQEVLSPEETIVLPALHRESGIDHVDLPLSKLPKKTRALRSTLARDRFAHLKIFGLQGEDGGWIFSGSANATCAALDAGKNVEAGLLRSVPDTTFDLYFRGKPLEKTVPLRSETSAAADGPAWIVFWASSSGDDITVTASPAHQALLPLRAVRLRVRQGARTHEAKRAELFREGNRSRLAWREFPGAGLSRGPAFVEIEALSAHGKPVAGGCFVDDLVILSSTPGYRAALRAVLALIDGNGTLPELHDAIALTTMFLDALAPAERPVDSGSVSPGPTTSVQNPGTPKDILPAWPPRPAAGRRGFDDGDLFENPLGWVQRLIDALLWPSATEKPSDPSDEEGAGALPEDEEDADGQGANDEAQNLEPSDLEELEDVWGAVSTTFGRLEDTLHALEPSKAQAPRVWTVAVGILVSTLMTRRVVSRKSNGAVDVESVQELAYRFVSMLLRDREPDEDDDLPVLRPLAQVLSQHGERPNEQSTAVMLAILGYQIALATTRTRAFALNWWLVLRDAVDPSGGALMIDNALLDHVIDVLLVDPREPPTREAVRLAATELAARTWRDHPAFEDLREKLQEGPCRSAIPVGRFIRICPTQSCRQRGTTDPALGRLKDLRSVVCSYCGTILVPEALHAAFFQGAR